MEAAMRYDLERVKRNIKESQTVDLLDRITAYRAGMEPEAVVEVEDELRRRGVSAEDILAHAERWQREAIRDAGGLPARCSLCSRPAVAQGWGWHRVWGILPLFPCRYHYCADHQPTSPR
jgi:hypothetical protein